MSDTPTTPAAPRADREAAKRIAEAVLTPPPNPNRNPTDPEVVARDYLAALAELAEARAEIGRLRVERQTTFVLTQDPMMKLFQENEVLKFLSTELQKANQEIALLRLPQEQQIAILRERRNQERQKEMNP